MKGPLTNPFVITDDSKIEEIGHAMKWLAEERQRSVVVRRGSIMLSVHPGGKVRGQVIPHGARR